MATRNAHALNPNNLDVYHSMIIRPTRAAGIRGALHCYFVNRGRNTGAGAAYVYWASPNSVDTAGVFYTSAVPWAQITDVVGVGNYSA